MRFKEDIISGVLDVLHFDILHFFYFLSNFCQKLAFQIMQNTDHISNRGSLAAKLVLCFATSEFSGDDVLKGLLIGN